MWGFLDDEVIKAKTPKLPEDEAENSRNIRLNVMQYASRLYWDLLRESHRVKGGDPMQAATKTVWPGEERNVIAIVLCTRPSADKVEEL